LNISAEDATKRTAEQLLSLILNEKDTLKEYFLARRDFQINHSKKWFHRRTDEEKARLKAEMNAKFRERYRKQREAMGKSYSEGKHRKPIDQIKKDMYDPTKSRRPRNPRVCRTEGERI
jgi:translation elongation factor EF-G